jgi:hypothetical protein
MFGHTTYDYAGESTIDAFGAVALLVTNAAGTPPARSAR